MEIHEEINPFDQEENEDIGEEEIDYDQLKKRMWKDRILLQKILKHIINLWGKLNDEHEELTFAFHTKIGLYKTV